MDFKLAIQPRCDFCQRFLLRLHNGVKTTLCHTTVQQEYGVRSTSVESNIYRSTKFRLELPQIHEHNLKVGRPRTSRNIIESLQSSLLPVRNSGELSLWSDGSFAVLTLLSTVENSRKIIPNWSIAVAHLLSMVVWFPCPEWTLLTFPRKSTKYGLSSNILHGIINRPVQKFFQK